MHQAGDPRIADIADIHFIAPPAINKSDDNWAVGIHPRPCAARLLVCNTSVAWRVQLGVQLSKHVARLKCERRLERMKSPMFLQPSSSVLSPLPI